MKKKHTLFAAGAFALLAGAMPAGADPGPPGYITGDAPLLAVTGDGEVQPLLSVGDTVDGVMFEGLPDGVGIAPTRSNRGRGHDHRSPRSRSHRGRDRGRADTIDVYVAHEQTTVPFFGARDYTDASVTRWTVDTRTGRIIDADVAVSPDDGFLRFCSAFMAGPEHGFDSHVFFANEETNDIVDVPAGAPYGADPALAPQRQGGYVVALDTRTGKQTTMAGMGRLNHENTVALPGYEDLAMLTTDDTFSATTSQLYLYTAGDQKALLKDEGELWAFRVTHKNGAEVDTEDPFNEANDYLDLGLDDEMRGEFIRVPNDVARGQTAEAPQAALENWSIENNVFTFIRLEDVAVDRNNQRVVYVADTGASRVQPDPATGRIGRPSGAVGQADNGRVFKFVFNRRDPRKVDSFTVLADGDAPGHAKFADFTSPDNLDTSEASLMVQEDTDGAQIWRLDLAAGTWSAAASVLDPGGESSGITNASEWFGPGSWLVTVQAHDLPHVDETTDADGNTVKREEGQLVLLTLPGS
jgi:hypothetical protein